MEPISKTLKEMMESRKEFSESSYKKLTPKEWAERRCRMMNDEEGDLNKTDGYDCRLCRNKGYTFEVIEENYSGNIYYDELTRRCKCMKIRQSIRRMKQSGLEGTISRCTFEKYEATEEWQKVIKTKAMRFVETVENSVDKWFFIGGAIGCGKTHICTAISRELLLRGKDVKYMLWIDEATKLKGLANKAEAYAELIEPIKRAEVLYIDDFLKVVRGQNGDELPPTAADIRVAYEILNYRYQQPDLITIISSERHVSEIEKIDSAIGSRIYEKTKGNACNIARAAGRNYRTKDMEMI